MNDDELDKLANLKTVDKIDKIARQSNEEERPAFIARQRAKGNLMSGATVKEMISFALKQKKAELHADFESKKDVYRQAKRLDAARLREFGRRIVETRLDDLVVRRTVNAILTPGYMKFAENMRSDIEEMVANGIDIMRSDFQRQVEIEARKLEIAGKTTPSTATAGTIIYSVSGMNARFNINSTDASTNIVQEPPSELFRAIKEAIQINLVTNTDRDLLLARVDELEREVGRQTFGQKYAEFVAAAANHMTLLAPFLPALTQLLLGTR